MRIPLLTTLFLAAVVGAPSLRAAPTAPQDPDASQQQVDAALAEAIDGLAGHPDDPQLPKDAFGASDEALLATSSRDIADLLQAALPFARDRAKSPRFLFALGRAALAHGYERQARPLLTTASDRGSAAALAYLGYLAESDGKTDKASSLLQQAIANGFDSMQAQATLASLATPGASGKYDPAVFNRSDWIQALHDGRTGELERGGLIAQMYAGGLHNTLWASNILFIVDDPKFLLELDAGFSVALGRKMVSSQKTMKQATDTGIKTFAGMLTQMANARKAGASVAGELSAGMSAGMKVQEPHMLISVQAEQDARRLAMLYNTDPAAFRRIYRGLRKFAHGGKTPAPRARTNHPAAGAAAAGAVPQTSDGPRDPALEPLRTPIARGNMPTALYRQLQAQGQSVAPEPVFFIVGQSQAFMCGIDAANKTYRIEQIAYVRIDNTRKQEKAAQRAGRGRKVTPAQSLAFYRRQYPGIDYALGTYGHRFKTVEDITQAARQGASHPEWSNWAFDTLKAQKARANGQSGRGGRRGRD